MGRLSLSSFCLLRTACFFALRELRAAASALLAASAGVEEGTLGQAERPETSGAASFWTPQSRRGSPTELPKKVISLCHQLRSWEAANEHLAHLDAELGALEASRARRKDISREDANGGEGVRDGELAGRTDKGDREKEQQEEEELSLLLQHEREATKERLREVEASIEKTALLPEKEARNENVAIVEIRPAAGGEEAQLWATDLAEVRNMGRRKKTLLRNQEIFFSSFKHAWRHPISSTKLRLHLATH
ncbi:peptidyl-tRNA hydrolase domain-containing protein, partial [Toxoplasma gondii RUB]